MGAFKTDMTKLNSLFKLLYTCPKSVKQEAY